MESSENSCTEKQQQELEKISQEDQEEEKEEEEDQILRSRISSHPLFELLVETHLNCLKVGTGTGSVSDENEIDRGNYLAAAMNLKQRVCNNGKIIISTRSQSELDCFMETYCFALRKLKDAMEETQLKSMTFINSMHSQLRDLTLTPATASSSTDTSSKPNHC